MGHVHLHVRDVQERWTSYHGLIGFDVMGNGRAVWERRSSPAGGYHHHLGLNTWAGQVLRPDRSMLPACATSPSSFRTNRSLAEVAARLTGAGVTLASVEKRVGGSRIVPQPHPPHHTAGRQLMAAW